MRARITLPFSIIMLCLFFRALSAEPPHNNPQDPGPKRGIIDATAASKTKCEEVPNYGFKPRRKGATAFWDREGIGLDLARKYVEKMKNYPVGLGVIDGIEFRPHMIPAERMSQEVAAYGYKSPFKPFGGGHPSMVASKIFSPAPFGGSATGKFEIFIPQVTADDSVDKDKRKAFLSDEELAKTMRASPVRLYNRSMSIPITKDKIEMLRLASGKNHLLVNAAGNRGFFDTNAGNDFKDAQVAFVGAVNCFGSISEFTSTENTQMNLMAPADASSGTPYDSRHQWYGGSLKADEMESFPGTSNAAPSVTAALSNALALVPNLTSQELMFLSNDTAFHRGFFGKLHQLPVINAYRLVRVVERINARCPYDAQAEGKSLECRKDLRERWKVERKKIFDFTEESAGLVKESERLLASDKCDDRVEGLTKLREAFFINATPDTGRRIEKILLENDYPLNAAFYHSLYSPPENHLPFVLETLDLAPEELRGLSRDLKKANFDVKGWVSRNLEKPSSDEAFLRAVRTAGLLDPKDAVALLEKYAVKSRDPKVQRTLHEAYKVGNDPYGKPPLEYMDLFLTMLEESKQLDYAPYAHIHNNTVTPDLDWLYECGKYFSNILSDYSMRGKSAGYDAAVKKAVDAQAEIMLHHPFMGLKEITAMYYGINTGVGRDDHDGRNAQLRSIQFKTAEKVFRESQNNSVMRNLIDSLRWNKAELESFRSILEKRGADKSLLSVVEGKLQK